VFSAPPTGRSTRIVATINPKATDDELKDILRAGADVARFNTAHGSVADKITVMSRQFAAEMGRDVSIQVDLEGPKLGLRTSENPKKPNNDIFLKVGETATLTSADVKGSRTAMLFPVDYPTMCSDMANADKRNRAPFQGAVSQRPGPNYSSVRAQFPLNRQRTGSFRASGAAPPGPEGFPLVNAIVVDGGG
jgi:hypothetical protein